MAKRKSEQLEPWRNAIVRYADEAPESLLANPLNWRVHPREQTQALTGSLNQVGWIAPVIVNETTQHVIDGHARIGEAIARGEPTVPVAYVQLTEDQERLALATFDPIAAMAGTDQSILDDLLSGITATDGLTDLLASLASEQPKALNDDDADLTPPAEPITRPGDLWLMGEHRLLCGDSLSDTSMRRLIGAERLGCTFTSPPYAVGVDYGETYEDSIGSLRALLPALAEQVHTYTVPGGFIAINFGDVVPGSNVIEVDGDEPCEYPMAVEYWPVFRSAGWLLHTRRIWVKPHARVWSPWVIQSSRAASDWEHLWVWKRSGKAITARGERSAFGVWDTSHDEGVAIGKDEFGAGMATSFARWVLETHSNAADLVFEPFCGTGTTLVAAEQTGRRCFAGEISPAYCDVAVRRWETLTGKKAERA